MNRFALVAALGLAGCLDPLVSDDLGLGTKVLPAGTGLPSVADDPALAAQVEENDGVDGEVPRLTGFADGVAIHTWDLGPAPTFAAPIYTLVRKNGAGFERVAHPSIIGTLPGDPGYSPYWAVFYVVVTDGYAGEILSSVSAIDEAVRRGLVEPPAPQDGVAVDCPVVAPDVTLVVGGGMPPRGPSSKFIVQGRTVDYYDLGLMAIVDNVRVPDTQRYLLRREGEEPLSEPVRNVDMDGDGDLVDSNDIFDLTIGDPAPPVLCRTVTVAVRRTIGSIDTSQDETVAELRSATQLFAPAPVTANVVGYQITDELRHCVLQRQAGGL